MVKKIWALDRFMNDRIKSQALRSFVWFFMIYMAGLISMGIVAYGLRSFIKMFMPV